MYKMKKKLILLVLSVFLLSGVILSKKVGQFSELANPSQVAIGHNQIYFADGTTVYIYSFDKHELIKKFGRNGEGPEEFKTRPNRPIRIILRKDCFYVTSLNKISKYKINGDFIKEAKSRVPLTYTYPLGDNYVAKGFIAEKDIFYFTINIYDSQFKIIKELYRERMDPRNKMNAIDATGPEILVYMDKIFINTTRNRNCFDIFNSDGKLLYSIKNISPPIPLTEKIKNNFVHYLKTDPKFKRIYERLKDRLVYPEFLPMIRYILADNNNLVALSYPGAKKKRSLYIFDLNGKQIKKIDSPLVSPNVEEVLPFTFYKEQLYQIVDNDDEWELHRFDIVN